MKKDLSNIKDGSGFLAKDFSDDIIDLITEKTIHSAMCLKIPISI